LEELIRRFGIAKRQVATWRLHPSATAMRHAPDDCGINDAGHSAWRVQSTPSAVTSVLRVADQVANFDKKMLSTTLL
jgi:hypothetical protein